ncbi:hypothetical protein OF83DRAFT_1169001 [Amylostereum chailletii]|nr:hypothetical protein OF83DRAFT_1169001 [Amylostereum chailletii]
MASLLVAPLTQLGQLFSPAPPVSDPNYDGLEFSYKFLVFRPAELKLEAVLLSALLLYISFFWSGKNANLKKAQSWFAAHRSIYHAQFSRPEDSGLTTDGYSDFFTFSTGRRLIASLHTVFTLRPRHDLLQYIFQFLWTNVYDLKYDPKDEILLDFAVAHDASVPDFVWAIVAKSELHSIKKERWDLSFTKTSENTVVPQTMSIMSEFADVTENFIKLAGPLFAALKDPKVHPYFRSLSVTDQPRQVPESVPFAREHHVLLSLVAPPPSDAPATVPLVAAVFQMIDNLQKISLRPDTKIKIKKARDDFAKAAREEAEKEAKEEAADAKAAAKKKAEDERMAGLSAAEQTKALERERKRLMRKNQGKTAIRK